MRQENFKLYQVFISWIVLNILRQNVSKNQTKKIELYQVFMCWIVLNILAQMPK